MRYIESDETRKKLNFALENVASKENVPIINELTKKETCCCSDAWLFKFRRDDTRTKNGTQYQKR